MCHKILNVNFLSVNLPCNTLNRQNYRSSLQKDKESKKEKRLCRVCNNDIYLTVLGAKNNFNCITIV